MRMEIAEVIIDTEEEFGISVRDDGPRMETVGEMIAFVQASTGKTTEWHSLAVAFRALRDALMAETGADRRKLRPSALLVEIAPWHRRHRLWGRLSKRVLRQDYDLPGLELNRIGCALQSACLVAILYCSWRIHAGLSLRLWAPAFLLVAALLVVIVLVFKYVHVGFPEGCATIGDLARKMKPLVPLPSPEQLAAADGGSPQVRTRIFQILSDRLGVPVEKISLETTFRDLGA